jgi:hypothetical protein
MAEPAAELNGAIAAAEPCIEEERAGSIVMDLADGAEPRIAGPAGIEDVLVAVDGYARASFGCC